MRWHRFYNCTIEGVEIPNQFPKSITLYISNDELQKKLNEPYKVSFWFTSSKTKNQIQELINGKREYCYFANGMQDIDIYIHGEGYAILHSPHEMENRVFYLKEGQIEKVLKEIELNFRG